MIVGRINKKELIKKDVQNIFNLIEGYNGNTVLSQIMVNSKYSNLLEMDLIIKSLLSLVDLNNRCSFADPPSTLSVWNYATWRNQ